jgi:hypothetical protein
MDPTKWLVPLFLLALVVTPAVGVFLLVVLRRRRE